MNAENSVPVNKSLSKGGALASAQEGKMRSAVPPQGQRNNAPVTHARSSNPASLLNAAPPPADRVAIIDGPSITTSVNPAYPIITTTTNASSTTVTSTTTTTPQPRVVLLETKGDTPPPVWDHYAECATLIHSTVFNATCGSELVRQIGRIPCTTNFYPADDAFADGFIEVVKGSFASEKGMTDLKTEQQSWIAFQARAPAAQQEKLSVWIRLFNYALAVAETETLNKDKVQAGLQDPAGKLTKWRSAIDGVRRDMARIHLGDQFRHDTSWMMTSDNASGGSKAQGASHKHRRASSMTTLFSGASPAGGKKTLPQLPKEELAGFDSKEKALLAWKKKADKQFDKDHVDRSVLGFFEQCLEAITEDRPELYCIAYKFVALITFAEAVRDIAIRDALVEETSNELGYVNEILAFREKLKAVVRRDSDASSEDKAYCQMWLDFFMQVSVLMEFRRNHRDMTLSDSPAMTETLVACEIAYCNVVKKMREANDSRHKQDEDAQAKRKAARVKERRFKGRSMDFLMPSKEKRAAQPSGTHDNDAIGPSPRKKITRQGKQREDIRDEDPSVKTKASMDRPDLQGRKSIRKNLPVAESLPDSEPSAISQPTSQRGVSKTKKKSATFEVTQQEAGPVRAGEKKTARFKSKAIQQEREKNADAREIGEGDKPRKGGKEEKEGKEEKMERTEKMEKKPGKAGKGTKDD